MIIVLSRIFEEKKTESYTHDSLYSYIHDLVSIQYNNNYGHDIFFKDIRLSQIFESELDKNCDVVSFDFFDTFVYRLSNDPIRIFIEVGRRLKAKNLLPEYITPTEFLALRCAAEDQARKFAIKMRGNSECSIEEIYRHLRIIVRDVISAVNVELETEKDFCFVNLSIASLATHFKEKGKKIAILSDSYFSSDQILSILSWNGFPVEKVDLVLTSSDAGAMKSSGELFNIAIKKLNVLPKRWIHIGDNELADVKGASKAGIRSIHYPKEDEFLDQIITAEQHIMSPYNKSTLLDAFRFLAAKMHGDVPENMFLPFFVGACIWGPLLARYIDWCITQCQKENIKKVLVFMREAHTLLPMLKNAVNAYGLGIDVYPFFVSRHSVNLASISSLTAQVLFERTQKRRTPTPRRILQALEIPLTLVPEITEDLMDVELNEVERMTLCKILTSIPRCRSYIMQTIEDKREKFIAYIKPFIEDEKKIGVMDLGFGGTIQERIEKILRYKRIRCKLVGLYFFTNYVAAKRVLKGIDIRSFLGGLGGWEGYLSSFARHPEILEQSIIAPFGTTVGYSYDNVGNPVPIIEDFGYLPNEIITKRHYIIKGIFEFHRIWLSFVVSKIKKGKFIDNEWLREIDEQCISIICRVSGLPFKEEAECLGSLYHDDNDGTTTGDYICNEYSINVYNTQGLLELLRLRPYWPQGIISCANSQFVYQLVTTFRMLMSL